MVAMRDEGLIGAVGLSNVTFEEYRAAQAITEVACVQNAYNLADRSDQACSTPAQPMESPTCRSFRSAPRSTPTSQY
jgi:aryl-alcohol dehydrogenase-like predicted oxidoreductase